MSNKVVSQSLKLLLILLFLPLILYGQTNNLNLNPLSLSTTKIILCRDAKKLGQGTGFFLQYTDSLKRSILFLVTNYHVLTGSAPEENKKPIGNNIIFYLHTDSHNPRNQKEIRYPLFTKDNKPVWLTSKKYESSDVAIIPLPLFVYKDLSVTGIPIEFINSPMKVAITSPITLIGYPYNFSDSYNNLPIWKSGNIASEPKLDFDNNPLFLIDISAFPGMSGSPVVALRSGMIELENGQITEGRALKFLGIYSAMENYITKDTSGHIIHSESMDLGYVWKASLILDLIKKTNFDSYVTSIIHNL